MSLRDALNQNSTVAIAALVVLILAVLAMMFMRGDGTGGGAGGAYYYDTVTKKVYTDTPGKLPPYTNDAGNKAVLARYFSCGGCSESERFLGYYERYSEEFHKRMEKPGPGALPADLIAKGSGREISTDGETWVTEGSSEGAKIREGVSKKCPDKFHECLP